MLPASAAEEQGRLGVLEIVTDAQGPELSAPVIVTDKRVSALILMGQSEQRYVEMIMTAGLPTVLLNFYCDGPDMDAIVSDRLSGCYQLTRHLIELSRRAIGFVGSVHCTNSNTERYSGYTRAMIFEGLSGTLLTAFVCENGEIAMRLIAQLSRRDMRVPEDVSATGFVNCLYTTLSTPPLTTYSVDQGRMTQVAVRRLLSRIKGGLEVRCARLWAAGLRNAHPPVICVRKATEAT